MLAAVGGGGGGVVRGEEGAAGGSFTPRRMEDSQTEESTPGIFQTNGNYINLESNICCVVYWFVHHVAIIHVYNNVHCGDNKHICLRFINNNNAH